MASLRRCFRPYGRQNASGKLLPWPCGNLLHRRRPSWVPPAPHFGFRPGASRGAPILPPEAESTSMVPTECTNFRLGAHRVRARPPLFSIADFSFQYRDRIGYRPDPSAARPCTASQDEREAPVGDQRRSARSTSARLRSGAPGYRHRPGGKRRKSCPLPEPIRRQGPVRPAQCTLTGPTAPARRGDDRRAAVLLGRADRQGGSFAGFRVELERDRSGDLLPSNPAGGGRRSSNRHRQAELADKDLTSPPYAFAAPRPTARNDGGRPGQSPRNGPLYAPAGGRSRSVHLRLHRRPRCRGTTLSTSFAGLMSSYSTRRLAFSP